MGLRNNSSPTTALSAAFSRSTPCRTSTLDLAFEVEPKAASAYWAAVAQRSNGSASGATATTRDKDVATASPRDRTQLASLGSGSVPSAAWTATRDSVGCPASLRLYRLGARPK